jgi:5-methylthioribose kinase
MHKRLTRCNRTQILGRMDLLDAKNAADYLRSTGRISADERVAVRELSGGVSNEVLYVTLADRTGGDFVLKQARAQLRTPQPWFSAVDRIWREVEVLRICQTLLAEPSQAGADALSARTPAILFEDREQYLFAMTAAPADHRVWKQDLLAGQTDPEIARACGRLLARMHAGTWQDAEVARRIGDQKIFDELRLEPYYRSVARAFPEAEPHFVRLIQSLAAHPRSLVHADFSPKNLLVYAGGLMMVDFETGHFGDPAFDLGFFLSHLTLKAAHAAGRRSPFLALTQDFWQTYAPPMRHRAGNEEFTALVSRGIQNLAGCIWARLDGTSRVDYLDAPRTRDALRTFCRGIFAKQPSTWEETLLELENQLRFLDN